MQNPSHFAQHLYMIFPTSLTIKDQRSALHRRSKINDPNFSALHKRSKINHPLFAEDQRSTIRTSQTIKDQRSALYRRSKIKYPNFSALFKRSTIRTSLKINDSRKIGSKIKLLDLCWHRGETYKTFQKIEKIEFFGALVPQVPSLHWMWQEPRQITGITE